MPCIFVEFTSLMLNGALEKSGLKPIVKELGRRGARDTISLLTLHEAVFNR